MKSHTIGRASSAEDTFFYIKNRGSEIEETDYWNTKMAQKGVLYLSWNAGDARVLVPAKCNSLWPEFKTGKYCIISQGPASSFAGSLFVELLFEDHSDAPFAIQMGMSQVDTRARMIFTGRPEGFNVTMWNPKGKILTMPGKLRLVPEIPYLLPW